MNLEVGKRYLCRNGFTTKLIIQQTGKGDKTLFWDAQDNAYYPNGNLWVNTSTAPHPQDLVQEVKK